MFNTIDPSSIAPNTPVQVYFADETGESRWMSNFRFIADHGVGGVEVQEWSAKPVSRFVMPNQVRLTPAPRVAYVTPWEERTLDQVSFGLQDSKGRELGIRFRTWIEVVVEGPVEVRHGSYQNSCSFDGRTPGVYSVVNGHTTRGSETFGALTKDASFSSEAERSAYIAKRTSDARKNAAKLAAKGG